MKRVFYAIVFLALFGVMFFSCHSDNSMVSPNGRVRAEIVTSQDGGCGLRIMYVDESGSIVEAMEVANLGLTVNDSIAHKFRAVSFMSNDAVLVEDYDMLSGKKSHCHNEAREYSVILKAEGGMGLTVHVRLYNNGVAFRYSCDSSAEFALGPESTAFVIPDGSTRWMSEWDWNKAYERFYPRSNVAKQAHFQFPFLVQAADNCFVLVTEADVSSDNAAASIYNRGGDSLYVVASDINNGKFTSYVSPWRVVMVGSLASIVENTLVTDLAPRSEIDDTSWIKPGVASWIYWAYNHGSNDFQIVKKYIDMAAKFHLPYVLIDAEWDEMKNGGNIEDAIKYAKNLGVDCLIWYNSSTAWVSHGAPGPFYRLNKLEDREREFAWLDSMGVKGVKIDFFPGDTQETMAYCIDLLKSAAKYHLLVNFHGATIPRGWQRTYPNLMSTEAVRGAEWYNNGPDFTEPAASHNATLPFTRNVVGSMDYTPCTFSDSQFPHITTNAHELALTVLFESGIQHLADKPESYYAQPQKVQDFLSNLPSAWDDTKLIDGYPGDFAVLARRKGDRWYIGCVNGGNVDRIVDLDLSCLGSSLSNFTIFEDLNPEDHTWKITESVAVSSFKCFARGGFVIVAE